MTISGNVAFTNIVVGRWRRDQIQIGAKIQSRLSLGYSEAFNEVSAISHTPPSKTAIQINQTLSLSMFEVIKEHESILSLTQTTLSIYFLYVYLLDGYGL